MSTGTLTKGTTFANRYNVLEELGEGGMGQVFKVYDTKVNEHIAIKLLKPEIAADKQVLARFSNELKFARKITHKNICRMHDINEVDGTTFITMEYVEGEDLKSVIRRKKKLRTGHIVSIALQITDALVEAHGLNIIHRDLKPQNIMIDKEGDIRIMDFGIARALNGKGVTNGGMILGSPEYMSPEQVDGKKADQRSDIYSLGVILYEMATATVPFKGATPFDTALKHKSEEPNDPMTINTQMPVALAQTILRCMEKDNNKRYQSAELLLADLLEIQETLPEKEKVATRLMPRIPTLRKEKPFLQRALFPAVAVAAVGLILWKLLTPTPIVPIEDGRPRIAVLPFQNNTGDPSLDHWRDTLALLLTNDLMQSKYFSVISEDRVYEVLKVIDYSDNTKFLIEDLKKFREEAAVSHLIQGSMARAGDNFRINVTLIDAPSLDAVAAENTVGTSEESLFFMVDELTRKLKPHFNLTDEQIIQDFDTNIGEVTSPNPRALEFYVEALKTFRLKADYEQTASLLERAIALDPDFASAYRFLAETYTWLSAKSNVEFDRKKVPQTKWAAYEAMQRRPVTERVRLLIESIYFRGYGPDQDHNKGYEALHKLSELYPDDYYANRQLGFYYYQRKQEYEISRIYYTTLVRNNQAGAEDYSHFGMTYDAQGRHKEAQKIYQQGISKFPDHWHPYCALASSYNKEKKFNQALSVCAQAANADPLHQWQCGARGNTFLLMEDFEAAEEEFKKLLENDNPNNRNSGRTKLINLYSVQGRFKDIFALPHEVVESGDILSNEIKSRLIDLHTRKGDFTAALELIEGAGDKQLEIEKAILYSKMHFWEDAEKFAEIFRERMEKADEMAHLFPKFEKSLYFEIVGRIELEKGNYLQAIDYLEQSKSWIADLHDPWFAFMTEPLAWAHYKAGDLENAKSEFEQIISMTTGRINTGDIYATAYYMLGKILEELGERKEAIRHYERFLELWKNADPGLPEVDDARARLASLIN